MPTADEVYRHVTRGGQPMPLKDIRHQAILYVLDYCQGNVSKAARLLNVHPGTVRYHDDQRVKQAMRQ